MYEEMAMAVVEKFLYEEKNFRIGKKIALENAIRSLKFKAANANNKDACAYFEEGAKAFEKLAEVSELAYTSAIVDMQLAVAHASFLRQHRA